MKPVRIIAHVLTDAAVIAAALGIPVLLSDQGRSILTGTDAVSSASVVIDAPSGEFLVLLNPELHPNEENLTFWTDFFSGKDVTFCFEDISCMVARNDTAALDMAQSYASRLSEHQMTVRQEDITLMLSRADHGKFDVIVLSREMAEHYAAEHGIPDGTLRFSSEQTPQEETT
ncbi:MAG: hypothetical protein II916_09175 [Oscillospiraceae bacterium]|nr:hypothetical protein [Oscillospiraceae bacterium]